MVEPQKFFIGLMDFFSILLPGALLTYLVKDNVGLQLFGVRYPGLTGPEAWILFLFSAYLLGHFVFLIGSWLLDEHFYDPIRRSTPGSQFDRFATGKKRSFVVLRWLAWLLFEDSVDDVLQRTIRIKRHYLMPVGAAKPINAFQWSKARLTLKAPEVMAGVQRFEADSKFFRSLVIVLLIIIFWPGLEHRSTFVPISIALLIPALWRYKDQRGKATNQAYWFVLTLESQLTDGFRLAAPQQQPNRAGGVVYRTAGKGKLEYLLVQASDDPKAWVLPKGHIEGGELETETAVREVHEEAGVWARVMKQLDAIDYTHKTEQVRVRYFLMEAQLEDESHEARRHEWLPIGQAIERAKHQQTKDLLARLSAARP